jgi:hypothetical protein
MRRRERRPVQGSERVNDLELVIRAAAFAAHKHRDQRRKDAGATPYINHLIGTHPHR